MEESIFLNRLWKSASIYLFMPNLCIRNPFLCIMNLCWVCQTCWPHVGPFSMYVQWFDWLCFQAGEALEHYHSQGHPSPQHWPRSKGPLCKPRNSMGLPEWAKSHVGPYWAQPGCVAVWQLTSPKKGNWNVSFRLFCALFVHRGKENKVHALSS